jgi:general L-amino acid transport system permease protein
MTRRQTKVMMQIITLVIVGIAIYSIVATTKTNLERIGISSGFGFLSEPSGFEIGFTLWEFSRTSTYLDVFWVGIANSLLASSFAIVLCTIIGLVIGIAQLSSNKLTAVLARIYVEVFRNVPLLLNIFFWYFVTLNVFPMVAESLSISDKAFLNQRGLFLPTLVFEDGAGSSAAWLVGLAFVGAILIGFLRGFLAAVALLCLLLIGIAGLIAVGVLPATVELPAPTRFNISGGFEIVPELFALILGLSVYHGAFVAEYVRGGILSVPKGQSEAAISTGLSHWQTLRHVVIPQSLRVIIPPYISNNLNVLKNSSLGAAIAFPELVNVFAGTALNQTGKAIEIILMVMVFYFTMSMLISLVMNVYNKRVQMVER